MSAKMTSFWFRTTETVLLVMAFLLPLAFFLRTYDVTAIKTTIFEIGVLVLGFAWFFKGVERGRWELPEAARPLALPAFALLAWMVLRFAAAPYKLASLPGFIRQAAGIAVYLIALLEFGGVQNGRRFFGWLTAAAWVAGLYGLAQRLGLDPLPWKGAFGGPAFSTLGDPGSFALFSSLCIPLALTQWLDPERDRFLRRLDLYLLILVLAGLALTKTWWTFASVEKVSLVATIGIPLFFPSRRSLKAAGFSAVFLAFAMAAQIKGGGAQAPWSAEATQVYAAVKRLDAASLWIGHGPGGIVVDSALSNPAPLHNNFESFSRTTVGELGLLGAGLSLWLCAALAAAAWSARRRFIKEGAVGESCYMAGLLVISLSCLGSWAFVPECLMWVSAGMLGGLTVLARRGAFVSVLPLALREPARRRIYAPAMIAMLGLLVFPVRWFDSEIESNLALYYSGRGEFDQSLAHCARVVPGAQSYVASRMIKGDAYLALNRPEEALKTYADLDALSPDYGRINYQKAVAYAKLEDWKNAVASHAREAELDPVFVANYAGWAQAAKRLGDLAAAESAARKTVELEPNDPEHQTALAEIYMKERRVAEARKLEKQAAQLKIESKKKPRG